MNGHIVGYSPFTLKLRNGKTWRWIQTWVKRTSRAQKTQNAPNAPPFAASADLQATSRDAGSIPHRGYKLGGRQLTPKGFSSRSLPSRGAGEGGILPPKGESNRTLRQPKTPAAPAGLAPPPHRLSWEVPRPRVPSPSSREDAEDAGGKQRLRNKLQPQLPRASFALLPRLTQFCALLLSLTFLHRLPGTSIAAGCARAPGSSAPGG